MKRRIAAPAERCAKELGQQAIWKAKRLGRPVEAQCSRRRVDGSPFCLWHQPDRVETKRRLTNEAAIAIYAEVVRLRLEFGPPPIGQVWWRDGMERAAVRLMVPTLGEFARRHGITPASLSDMLRGKQYTSIGLLRVAPERRGRPWTVAEVTAALLWLRAHEGGVPTDTARYVALANEHPGLPSLKSIRDRFGGLRRALFLIGIPGIGRHHRWQPEEEEYIAEFAGLVSLATLAKTLGRSRNSVERHLHELGETVWGSQGYLTCGQAAREYGVPPRTLYNHAVRFGTLPYVAGATDRRRIVFLDPLDVEAWLERRRVKGGYSGSAGMLLAGGSE